MAKKELPLVYACSGGSDIAQLANGFAVRLNKENKAQMSCIAGVGGDITALVNVAKSGRPIIAIDGCPLECVKNCLARHGVVPTVHYRLSDYGLKKESNELYSPAETDKIFQGIVVSMANLQ